MGAEASKPEPGREISVIGAGLPRTGTASLTAALSTLLKGPVFHGGTQVSQGPEKIVRTCTKLQLRVPSQTPDNQAAIKKYLSQLLDGYVACTDVPTNTYVKELLGLYPDAKVVCTVRDPDDWAASMDMIESHTGSRYFLRFALFLVSPVRLFPAYADALRFGRYHELLGVGQGQPHRPGWEVYMNYIKANVPKDKLLLFNVKDGWGPLCEFLDLPVPDSPFPKTNEGEAIAKLAKTLVTKGLRRWAILIGVVTVVLAATRTFAVNRYLG